MSSSLSCIALVLDFLAYSVCNLCHALFDVLAIEMRGVMTVDVDARMELRISLSCLIQ